MSFFEKFRKLHQKNGQDWYEFLEFYPKGWKYDPCYMSKWSDDIVILKFRHNAVQELLFGRSKNLPLINSKISTQYLCSTIEEAEKMYQKFLREHRYIYDFLHSETGKKSIEIYNNNIKTINKLEKENYEFTQKVLAGYEKLVNIEEDFNKND